MLGRGRPLVLGLSMSRFLNLDISLIEASASNFKYSDLSITTTPVPLSGFVTIISSRCFRRLIAQLTLISRGRTSRGNSRFKPRHSTSFSKNDNL